MADIFFSYSRRDHERVGIVRNALADMGFEVFWDQETPSGSDWDAWIRGELAKSKCAVVFWSATSIVSDNVRHEAVVAKEQRKLISVFLDQLPARDLPMGFYSQQAADLSKWDGDQEDAEWRKFRGEFEAKLMPRWVQQKLNRVDAELEGERARRETAEAHEKTLRAQISKEAKMQQNLKGERDRALTEVGELRAAVEERDKALQAHIAKQAETEQVLKSQCDGALAEVAKFKTVLQERDATLQEQTAKQGDTEQGLKTERDRALAVVAKLKAAIEGLSRARPDDGARKQTKRWLNPIAVGIVLLAAVLGGTLASLFSSRPIDAPVEANAAQAATALAKSEQLRQAAEAKADQIAADADKIRQTIEAKAAETEKAGQAAEAHAADAEKARQTALARADNADRARLAAEAKAADTEKARQTAEAKAADSDKARQAAAAKADDADKAKQVALAKAADSDKARLAAEAKAAEALKAQATAARQTVAANVTTTVTTGQFSPGRNMEARGTPGYSALYGSIASVGDCEQICARSDTCKAFAYGKQNRTCYLYTSSVVLVANENFDSGIRK